MKTSSKAFLGIGIFFVLVIVAVLLLLSGLDRIVAAAIEKYGSEATGTKVGVSSVRIDLKGGAGSVRGLRVGNPPGFSSPDVFRLGDISVAVDTGTVTGNPVVIDRILVLAPRITYEIDGQGRSNIELLRKKLAGAGGGGSAGGSGGDSGKKVVIRRLVIEQGEIEIKVAALSGKPLSAALPRIELKNLGGKGGDTPGAIAKQVLGPLVEQAAASASRAGISQYLGKGADEVKRALEEAARGKLGVPGKDALQGAGEGLKKLFGK
ncbi:MAG: hypothetical protein Kow00128_02310 [Deltaproteobacteria bacterium]